MTLPASGPISFSDIQSEMGGQNPISLSEYYRGAYTSANNTGVPTSGTIDLSNLRGAQHHFYHTVTSSTEQGNLRSIVVAAGWNTTSPINFTIDSGVYMWSDSTSVGGLTVDGAISGGVFLNNYGYIIGRGGNGTKSDTQYPGGPALVCNQTGGAVTISNKSGAYIAGGGGGGRKSWWNDAYSAGSGYGGGGAGGGTSGSSAGGAIGAIGASGSQGTGGGAGGEGSSLGSNAAGGGGGRQLPGTGGSGASAGGDGGAAGAVGKQGVSHTSGQRGGGGGGWGAAGGANSDGGGAAGGKAIQGTGSRTLSNSGTVYGETT
jgi:hypothetical protein